MSGFFVRLQNDQCAIFARAVPIGGLDPEDRSRLRSSLDGSGGPKLSVVAVIHDIAREVPRTLLSLSAGCQRDIASSDCEVIVVDKDGWTGKGSHPWLC
jgi:hypothetical protein